MKYKVRLFHFFPLKKFPVLVSGVEITCCFASLVSNTQCIPVLHSVPDDECKLLVTTVIYNIYQGPWPSGD